MRRIALATLLIFSVIFVSSAPYLNWIPMVSAMGTVRLLITDPPNYSDNVTSIMITFSEIAINRVDGEGDETWIILTNTSRTVDLLQIINVTESLGAFEVPAGSYNQIRFMTSSAMAVINDHVVDLTIPSGGQTGLKVHFLTPLQVGVNMVVTVTVDITADDGSIHNGRLVPSMSATFS
jgi:hypothetical protein